MSKALATAFLLTFLSSGAAIANGAQLSSYAGQENREIKALSSEEAQPVSKEREWAWRKPPSSITTPDRRMSFRLETNSD